MKSHWDNKYFKIGLISLLVICGSIMFYYLLFHSSNIREAFGVLYEILMPVFFGMIMAYLLAPTLNMVEKKVLIPVASKLKLTDKKPWRKTIRILGIIITALFYYFIIRLIVGMLL